MILRRTKKLLAVLGPGLLERPAPPPDGEDWYANLVRLDGRQCLLLTHSATLFTILQEAVTAARLRATHRLVLAAIDRELRSESLPPDTFADPGNQTLRIAATADRSVLGCMNDMTVRCEYTIAAAGGLTHTDLVGLNRSLRRNINSARNYQQPIDLITQRIQHRHR